MCDFIALCCYVPFLQEGVQVRLVGSVPMDGFVSKRRNRIKNGINITPGVSSILFKKRIMRFKHYTWI